VDDRISGFENKTDIKEKTKRDLSQNLKRCERNMQEVSNSIKIPNLINMSIKEGQEVQATGICNISNKIIAENCPNLKKELSIQVQEACRTPNRHDQNKTSLGILLLK
jgi:hypothetical protein